MRHRKIRPKKGVHPTQYVEICPICEACITKFRDIDTDIITRKCTNSKCGWTNIKPPEYDCLGISFNPASELRKTR